METCTVPSTPEQHYERQQEIAYWLSKPPRHCYLYIDSLTLEVLTEYGDMVGNAFYKKPYQYNVVGTNNILYTARLDRMLYPRDDERLQGYFLDAEQHEQGRIKRLWKKVGVIL